METFCERIANLNNNCEELLAKIKSDAPRFPTKEYCFKFKTDNPPCVLNFGTARVLATGVTEKLYIILKGKVGIINNYQRPNEEKIGELGPGNFFAEELGKRRTATALSLEPVTILILDKTNAYKFFEKETEVTFSLIRTFCERIETLNKYHDALYSQRHALEGYVGHILYPDGHKNYTVPLNFQQEHLYMKYYSCPVCKKSFQSYAVKYHNLKLVVTDDDFRLHYESLDPIYFEVITCPHCWYSSIAEYFEKISTPEHLFNKRMSNIRNRVKLNPFEDINAIFTSYYLALDCISSYMTFEKETALGKVWLRLSWLYKDCSDSQMEFECVKNAHSHFLQAYNTVDMSEKQLQVVLLILGVLCYKVGDINDSKAFLSRAKLVRGGTEKNKEKARALLELYKMT
jgi:uncharacterized protein (DUF2225 family)/CRP-like cAMP-binding protein